MIPLSSLPFQSLMETKNILIEVTGIDKDAVEDALSTVISTLQMAGFEFEELKDIHIAYPQSADQCQCAYEGNHPQSYPVEGLLCKTCTLEITFGGISDVSNPKAFDMPHGNHRRSIIKDHLWIIPICSNLVEQIRLCQIVLSTISI